jgi:hypothetical protein
MLKFRLHILIITKQYCASSDISSQLFICSVLCIQTPVTAHVQQGSCLTEEQDVSRIRVYNVVVI